MATAGCSNAFFAVHSEANEDTGTDFLAFSTAHPSSIRSCFEAARQNALSGPTAPTGEVGAATDGRWVQLARAAGTHAVATYLLENEPWDFAAVHYSAPGAISREFIDYLAPRLPAVSAAQFPLYAGVAAPDTICLDQRLVQRLPFTGPYWPARA
mgnify:CR=1 FL=1